MMHDSKMLTFSHLLMTPIDNYYSSKNLDDLEMYCS